MIFKIAFPFFSASAWTWLVSRLSSRRFHVPSFASHGRYSRDAPLLRHQWFLYRAFARAFFEFLAQQRLKTLVSRSRCKLIRQQSSLTSQSVSNLIYLLLIIECEINFTASFCHKILDESLVPLSKHFLLCSEDVLVVACGKPVNVVEYVVQACKILFCLDLVLLTDDLMISELQRRCDTRLLTVLALIVEIVIESSQSDARHLYFSQTCRSSSWVVFLSGPQGHCFLSISWSPILCFDIELRPTVLEGHCSTSNQICLEKIWLVPCLSSKAKK